MSDVINAVKRLERAGSERSRATEKLRDAAKTLADEITRLCPTDHPELPRGYRLRKVRSSRVQSSSTFLSNADGELIDGYDGYLYGDFSCPLDAPSRESVLRFAADVATGWLDEVAEAWEKSSANDDSAAEAITKAVEQLNQNT